MNSMFRNLLIVLLVLSLSLIQSCCACTMQGCFEGIVVSVEIDKEGAEYIDKVFPKGEYTLRWESGDSSGEVNSDDIDGMIFRSEKELDILIKMNSSDNSYQLSQKNEEITLELFFNGASIGDRSTYPLEWVTSVCNECSGGPWCVDDMFTSAYLIIVVEGESLVNF